MYSHSGDIGVFCRAATHAALGVFQKGLFFLLGRGLSSSSLAVFAAVTQEIFFLQDSGLRTYFPRGFPQNVRGKPTPQARRRYSRARIVLNLSMGRMGFWWTICIFLFFSFHDFIFVLSFSHWLGGISSGAPCLVFSSRCSLAPFVVHTAKC